LGSIVGLAAVVAFIASGREDINGMVVAAHVVLRKEI
jgi:hypothetical protein